MKDMKVLLIEDTPELVSVILRGLEEEQMQVSVAADGTTGLEMALKYDFNIIILDIMLPGLNGIQVCREIRQRNLEVPILMLTALASTENIVTGLESGADDYVVKPFKLAELTARMRTLVRRSGQQAVPPDRIRVADLELNLDARAVTKGGQPVNLTATEYRLLEYLLKNQNRVLSRIQILENVWDIDFNMGTNVVDVYINYLRKKIDQTSGIKLIHTVFGMGYILKEDLTDETAK